MPRHACHFKSGTKPPREVRDQTHAWLTLRAYFRAQDGPQDSSGARRKRNRANGQAAMKLCADVVACKGARP